MSIPSRRIILVVAITGAAVAAALATLWLTPNPPSSSMEVSPLGPDVASPPPAAARPTQPTERTLAVRTAAPSPEDTQLDTVLAALAPDSTHMRCAAAGLSAGRYDAAPPLATLVQVSGGQLHAMVGASSGNVQLKQAAIPTAQLSWDDAGCTVQPMERTTVSGTLTDADGAPADGFSVQGCLHGEVARTDANGRWSLSAVQGTRCWPMAFVEAQDGAFGRSAPIEVVVNGPVDGVSLTLPPEDKLWSPDQQRAQAEAMAQLFERRLSYEQQQLDTLEARAERLSGEAADSAQQLIAHEAGFVAHVEGEIERLRDPEEQLDALQEAWLSLN